MRASRRHQLDELLGNSGFLKTVDLISKEFCHIWNVSDRDAYRVVLSAIGEPATLACVHAALSPTQNLALAKVIYGALGNRRSIGNAFAQGVAALAARQPNSEHLPRWLTRDGVDADRVVLYPLI